MRTIWLIRHAESRGNAGEVTDDPHSISLSDLGRRQAAELATHFTAAPDLIVVTPYVRTSETARPTMERFPESPVVEWPLHEFTFLSPAYYFRKTQEDRRVPAQAYWERNDPNFNDGEDAESFHEFRLRLRAGLARMRECAAPFTAIFAHGYVIKGILLELLSPLPTDPKKFMDGFAQFHRTYAVENGMIVPLLLDAGGSFFIGTPMHPLLRQKQAVANDKLD